MSYHPWSEHNKALKNPEYQMLGLLDCLREELMMNMPIQQDNIEPPRRDHIHYHFRLPDKKSISNSYNKYTNE